MIDIHCHLLFGVDDGAETLDESVRMLQRAKDQGVKRIILTPHYRHGMFPYRMDDIRQNFKKLLPYAKETGIAVYLGCEYHVDSQCAKKLNSGRCLTLAESSYVLCEYSHITEYSYILSQTQELMLNGYKPVIAHAERYPSITDRPERAQELRRMGAMIQVNADAVLGIDGKQAKKFCKKLLKEEQIDIIASDSHGLKYRACNLGECRDYIKKKYGTEAVRRMFCRNPAKILKDE